MGTAYWKTNNSGNLQIEKKNFSKGRDLRLIEFYSPANFDNIYVDYINGKPCKQSIEKVSVVNTNIDIKCVSSKFYHKIIQKSTNFDMACSFFMI